MLHVDISNCRFCSNRPIMMISMKLKMIRMVIWMIMIMMITLLMMTMISFTKNMKDKQMMPISVNTTTNTSSPCSCSRLPTWRRYSRCRRTSYHHSHRISRQNCCTRRLDRLSLPIAPTSPTKRIDHNCCQIQMERSYSKKTISILL